MTALLGADCLGLTAQTRSDTLAVIAAVLERPSAEEGLFLNSDAPELVKDAGQTLPDGTVQQAGDALTFCSDEVAENGDNIGEVISVSLEPGDGPRPPPQPRDPVPADAPPADLRQVQMEFWLPAFYMDANLAYVSVSRTCYLRPMGGLINIELADGRRVSASSSGATYELRREGSAWVIIRAFNLWIT